MSELRPMIEPGLITALQPTSAPSPMSAPNLRRPVVRICIAHAQGDEVAVELEVGDDDARREMHLRAEDRIADVIEMGHLAVR